MSEKEQSAAPAGAAAEAAGAAAAPPKHAYFWMSIPMDDLTPTLLAQVKQDIATLSGVDNPTVFMMARVQDNINDTEAAVRNSAAPIIIGGNTYRQAGVKGTPPGSNHL